MHGELDISALFDDVYGFIEKTVFPSLVWPEFERIFSEYRTSRASTTHSYVDTLPILTCVAAGGFPGRSLPLAAAWVLFILASKILDEVQDKDGQEDLWNKGSISTALPAGLFALGAAKASLAQLEVDSDSYAGILGAFGNTMALAAKAQKEQLLLEALSVERYFEILAAKTGLIFATGAWAGARLSAIEPDPDVLDKLYQYGLNTGIAGQIIDDCLDLDRGDLINNIYTLPVIYALSKKHHPQHSRLSTLLHQLEIESTRNYVERAIVIMKEMGAVEWSLQISKVYARKALAALHGLPHERVKPLVEYAAGSRNVVL